jgi:ubiquinone/menaquinone biosynthesis C-methylase UbiE/uncharacterized protein YbaR (Trm112 family)
MKRLDPSEATGNPTRGTDTFATARSLFVCPACLGTLTWSPSTVRCSSCSATFSIVDDIPVLLLNDAHAHHDELEHMSARDHKMRQANYFDEAEAVEFEIERPHRAPALYEWLVEEKFRRSVAELRSSLPGATVLAVCGGSGMDAEFLARLQAKVIVSDISIGAIRRARERSQRYGLELVPLVADVEHLPFRADSVDVVYVHDGLHHLDKPERGLLEMARVARRAVSVNEPARAAITALAVRLGLARNHEEAGNRVARLTATEVESQLASQDFEVVHRARYGMYYRHKPGRFFRILSSPVLFPVVKTAFRSANAAFGQLGNKLTIQAVQRPQ